MSLLETGNKIFRYVMLFILVLLFLILLYFVSAWSLSRIEVKGEPFTSQDISIYLLTNGVHADLVVPVKTPYKDWSTNVRFEHTLQKDSTMDYLALGWGDKVFYIHTPTWADLKLKTAFTSILGLHSAAIHTTFYSSMTERDDCIRIGLTSDQYNRLIDFIENSFVQDEHQRFIPIQPSVHYGNNDTFYEAHGRYHLFYTSNTWTNDGLKACGQMACLWTPFDKGIFYHYRKKMERR